MAVTTMAACSNAEGEDVQPEQEIELTFSSEGNEGYDNVRIENLTKVLNSVEGQNVKIYLVPEYRWDDFSNPKGITNLRKNILEPAINLSPKIWGRGDFNFRPGLASQVPADSLWYVQHGWTINKGQ